MEIMWPAIVPTVPCIFIAHVHVTTSSRINRMWFQDYDICILQYINEDLLTPAVHSKNNELAVFKIVFAC